MFKILILMLSIVLLFVVIRWQEMDQSIPVIKFRDQFQSFDSNRNHTQTLQMCCAVYGVLFYSKVAIGWWSMLLMIPSGSKKSCLEPSNHADDIEKKHWEDEVNIK